MVDSESTPTDDPDGDGGTAQPTGAESDDSGDEEIPGNGEGESPEQGDDAPQSTAELRRQVEEKYDFDDFGPADMAEMSADEWEAAFDPDTWITGERLLDRVEADLKNRVADRQVFARVERREDTLIAYSDTGYATVYDDGTVEGHGTVLRDVKPTVALCSMESYDVPPAPEGDQLPDPAEVPEASGELGNLMLQVVAGSMVLAGLGMIGVWLLSSLGALDLASTQGTLNVILLFVAGAIFVAIGAFLFLTVANARLSDRFRAEEFRNRLRAVELDPGEEPPFLPDGDEAADSSERGDDDPPDSAGESRSV